MTERDEKQAIEEIDSLTTVLYEANHKKSVLDYHWLATEAYNAGYRKQREGEWVETDYKTVEHGFVERRGKAWLCTNCRHASKEFHPNMKFCPNCGAKMKGDKNEHKETD